jgi:hypothetical protein
MALAIPVIDGILKIGSTLIERLIPDPAMKAEAKLKLAQMQMDGDLKQLEADTQLAMQQILVNMKEAESPSLFKGGWRPMGGWICASGLGYQFVLNPFLSWGSLIYGYPVPPLLEIGTLMTLLFGMLGLGSFRSYEKAQGVAAK